MLLFFSDSSTPVLSAPSPAAPASPLSASAIPAALAADGPSPAPPTALHGFTGGDGGREPMQEPPSQPDLHGGAGDPAELHSGRGPVSRRGGHTHTLSSARPAQTHHHQVLPEPALLHQPRRQAERARGIPLEH